MLALDGKPFRFLSGLLVCKQLPGATVNGFRLEPTGGGSCVPRHREPAQLYFFFIFFDFTEKSQGNEKR